jgi:hypothetical protein
MRRRKPPTHDATAQVRVSSTGLAEPPRGHRKLCLLSVCSLLSRCRSWVILDRIGLSASCPVYPRSRPLGRTSRFGSFVKSILPHADEQSALPLSSVKNFSPRAKRLGLRKKVKLAPRHWAQLPRAVAGGAPDELTWPAFVLMVLWRALDHIGLFERSVPV